MAITLLSQPYTVMASFNSNYYKFTSTNSGLAGFKYLIRVNITGLGINYTQNYEVTPITGVAGYFDAQPVAGLLPVARLEATEYGETWKLQPTAIMTVEFAEFWTAAGPQPYNVTHIYQVWGASKNTIDLFKTQADAAFAYVWPANGSVTNADVLKSQMQNLITEKVYEDTSTYYSVWNYNSGNFYGLAIQVLDLQGNQISTSEIWNPDFNGGVPSNGHLMIDLGMSSLRSIVPNLGANPILPTGIDFTYKVSFLYDLGAGPRSVFLKEYVPTCSPTFPVYPIHYKSRLGAWETCIFAGNSIESLTREATVYEQFNRVEANVLNTSSGIYNPLYANSIEKIRNIKTGRILELNTLWLTTEEVDKYKDLFDSPQVYTSVKMNDNTNLIIELRPIPNTYIVNKRHNKKKFQLNMSFKFANIENRQA